MKTVLIDNSLCAYTLRDDASPEHIYKYIKALADAGVRYVEIDFRTIMKLRDLPKEIGYVFRLVDPMFLSVAELFDFDYILVTFADVRRKIKTDIPMMLELPVMNKLSGQVLRYAASQVDGRITAVRIRGSCPLMEHEEAARYVARLKNEFPVPLDFCPMNDNRTALDSAVKLSLANADSLTLSMGVSERFCSLEEYFFTLMSVYNMKPKEFSSGPLCAATVFHSNIFRSGHSNGIIRYMDILDHDIHFLRNADTGERVSLRVGLKDTEYIHRGFLTALERMAKDENIPDDIFKDLNEAVRHYDTDFYSPGLMKKKHRGLLN